MHAYAESLVEGDEEGENKDYVEKEGKDELEKSRFSKGGADMVIICGGTLRGDSQYGPGKITLGDILGEFPPRTGKYRFSSAGDSEIMPFDDPVVCLEVSR